MNLGELLKRMRVKMMMAKNRIQPMCGMRGVMIVVQKRIVLTGWLVGSASKTCFRSRGSRMLVRVAMSVSAKMNPVMMRW